MRRFWNNMSDSLFVKPVSTFGEQGLCCGGQGAHSPFTNVDRLSIAGIDRWSFLVLHSEMVPPVFLLTKNQHLILCAWISCDLIWLKSHRLTEHLFSATIGDKISWDSLPTEHAGTTLKLSLKKNSPKSTFPGYPSLFPLISVVPLSTRLVDNRK